MGECIDESLQQFAIITYLINRSGAISKKILETQVNAIAKRLSVLNDINTPELIDTKAQTKLITTMVKQGYINTDEENKLIASDKLTQFTTIIMQLIDIDVLQSITR